MGSYIGFKIFMDQLVFEPPYLLVFFSSMKFLEGHGVDEVKTTVKNEYVNTFILDCAIWPGAQYLNFRYIPLKFQGLYVNGISLAWASFLSFVSHRDHKEIVAEVQK
jgi:protein Mpv17